MEFNAEIHKVLDVCCSTRSMWFNKQNPNTLYVDIRDTKEIVKDCRNDVGRLIVVKPDIVADFRNLPFANDLFWHVVFDPPHLEKLGHNSDLAKKYGRLLPTWEDDIKQGFSECFRVLKPNGTLNFKWNEQQIKLTKILELTEYKPLYSQNTGKNNATIWVTFVKI